MPTWNIHLAVAKEVNKKLKLEKNSFYFGNTVPDIDYNMKVSRHLTHYSNLPCPNCPKEFVPNIKQFLKDYKNKLNNPLIMGMYVHLLTDYYFNSQIFSKYWVQDKENNIIGIKLLNGKIIEENNRKLYKHYDLDLYGKHLFKQGKVEIPTYSEEIYINMLEVKNCYYTKKDIKNRIIYLKNDFLKKQKYSFLEKISGLQLKMIDKQTFEKIYEDSIKFILKNINNKQL